MNMTLNKNEEKISAWLFKLVCEDCPLCTVLGFKVFEIKRFENILEVEYEYYVLETKNLHSTGLFSLSKSPYRREYFPYGVFRIKIKNKCTFDNKHDCEILGVSGCFDLPHFASDVYFDWSDIRLPESFIADLFDYRCVDSIGLKIIKKFNLLNGQSRIPDCIPHRLIPHLTKSLDAYRSLLHRQRGGMSLPQDLSLPLFVYGSLKPGMPAFESIANLVVSIPQRDQITGNIYLRDGLPLLFKEGSKLINGYILYFDSKKTTGYEHICTYEPKSQYEWSTAETNNGVFVNVLTGKQRQKGNPVAIESDEWRLIDDPAFGEGLPVVRRAMQEIIENTNWKSWEKFFRYQMAYLLLWSIVERLSALCVGPLVEPTQRVKRLHTLRGMNDLITKHVDRTDSVSDSRDPGKIYKLNRFDPETCFNYYYQVRSNLSHRGKAVPNELQKVSGSLPELLGIIEGYLTLLKKVEH